MARFDLRVFGAGDSGGQCPRVRRIDQQVGGGGHDEGGHRDGGEVGGGVDRLDQRRLLAGAAGNRGGGLTDDLSVWMDLAGRYEARVFCSLFMDATNEGLRLKPETLAAVSARGLYLDLDLYSPRDDQTP